MIGLNYAPCSKVESNIYKRKNFDQNVFWIRLAVLVLCWISNTLAFLTLENYPFRLFFLTFFSQTVHFYLLISRTDAYLLGIWFQFCLLCNLFCQEFTSENFFLSLGTILTGFILYSLQFYPLTLNFIFALLNFVAMIYHKSKVLESLQDHEKFLISAGARSWTSTALVIILSITIFQYYNEKIWRDWDDSKEQLIEKNKQLEQANTKMEEMLVDLKQANNKLKLSNQHLAQALKSQDLFVACVSHELRNPLNAMLGNIELLQLEPMDVNKKKMLKTCQICGEMLLVLINNILDVAKINAAKLEINVGIINMHSFVEKIWGVSRVRILQKGLYGTLVISKEVPLWLKGDFYRLIQIILNLIGNATKFTTNGGIKVLLSWEESKPSLKVHQEEGDKTPLNDITTSSFLGNSRYIIPDEYSLIGVNKAFLSFSGCSIQLNKLNKENG